jgi:hypothetical protein
MISINQLRWTSAPPVSLNRYATNFIVVVTLLMSGCAVVRPPQACVTDDRNKVATWRRLSAAPIDAAMFRHVLSLERGNDAEPFVNEAWFASSDERLMMCEVPASKGCDPWHATFVQSALGWETESGVLVTDRGCAASAELHGNRQERSQDARSVSQEDSR